MGADKNPPQLGKQPRYAVLAQALIEDISSGRYSVGAMLPTELELCQQFNVSRHTVREAIRRLQGMGLVSRQAGVGTTVLTDRIASRYVQAGERISDLLQYARDISLKVLTTQDIIADESLAELLGCKVGQAWLHVHGERFQDGDTRPMALNDVYIARAYRGVEGGINDTRTPIYAQIEQRYGVSAAQVRQQISAVALSPENAERLGVEPGMPGLQVVRHYCAANGEVFEVAVGLHPGDRFSYSSTLRIEQQDLKPEI